MIVATLLSMSVHADACKNYFLNYIVIENLNPKDDVGEYYQSYSQTRVRIASRPMRQTSTPSNPILIGENGNKRAYALSPTHLLIENIRQKTIYDFESTLPIEGRFSLKGSAWIILHKNLEIPKIQIWRFARVHGNLIEIPLDRLADESSHVRISESLNPINGHEIMTVLYEGYMYGKDQMLMIIMDLNTGEIHYRGVATLENVELGENN